MSTDRHDRGQMLVMVALASIALILVVGLVIDGGFAWAKRREAQNAADFAALAGTRVVGQNVSGTPRTNQDVYNTLSTIAAANNNSTVPGLGAASGALYVDSKGNPIAGLFVTNTADAIPADARGVQVPASRVWTPFFLGLIGVTNWTATATATARWTVGASAPCAFCVLGVPLDFTMQSAGTLLVNDGAIVSNAGLDMQNASLIATGTGSAIKVLGPVLVTGTPPSPAVTPMASPIPDPLAFLADPTPSGVNHGEVQVESGTQTRAPGIYSKLVIKSGATVTLSPGVHYFSGDGVSIQGGGTLTGTNVTLVFMGPQASLLQQSGSTINITAPAPTDTTATFPGLAFYFERGNIGTLTLQSGSTTNVTGTIYGRDALLDMQSGATAATLSSMIIVGHATMQSNSKLTVNYDSSQNVQNPGATSLVK